MTRHGKIQSNRFNLTINMKRTITTLAVMSAIIAPSQAAVVFSNGFQLYKPGTGYTVTAELSGPGPFDSYASGVGDNITLSGGTGTANYGDATTGTTVDFPGWSQVQGGNDMGKNGVGGSTGLNVFAAWGGDGRFETSSPVGVIQVGLTYTLSVMVDGPTTGPIQGPLALHLLANGTQLTPTSVVDIVTPDADGIFQQISRTYDAASLAGNIGESLTIIVGVEDANNFANRVIFDDVLLEAVPEPSSSLLLGLGGLALALRRRK